MSMLYPPTEAERVKELHRYAILNTAPEPAFDRITQLAARVFSVPIVLVSFIDTDHQWYKSTFGLHIERTERAVSFCSHAILAEQVMVVADTQGDQRFHNNPLVCGAPNIRFYAGAPLRTRDGHNLGTLCLIDTAPRTLAPEQIATLADLAAIVVDELELRLANLKALVEMRQRLESEAAQRRSEEQYRLLFDANPQPLLIIDPQTTRFLAVNNAATQHYGYTREEFLSLTLQDIAPVPESAQPADQLANGCPGIHHAGIMRHHAKAGSRLWVDVITHRIDFQGRPAILVLSRDVTQQYQTQMALRASESKLKLMTQQMPNLMWTCDKGLRLTSAQGAVLNQLNLPPQSYLGKLIGEFFGTAGPQTPAIQAHSQALRGTSSSYELMVRGRAYDARVEPLRDEHNQIVGCVGLAIDITERMRAEEARIASERRFRTIFERAGIGIGLVSLDGRLIETNPALQAMLGYTSDELHGKHFDELAHPLDVPLAAELFSQLAVGNRGSYEMEQRCLRKDGRLVWANLAATAMPAPGGEPQFVLAMLQDITARKQADQAISEAYAEQTALSEQIRRGRDLLRVLFDGLDDGLVLVDRDGTVLAVNQHLAQLLGSPPEQLVGTAWSAREPVKPDDFPKQVVFQTLYDGRPRRRRERHTTPSGQSSILDLQTLPRMGTGNTVDQVILHVADVTERVHMEALVLQNEALAANGKLAATMAHEINTPLQSIRSCLYLAGKVPEDQRETYLALAREEIDRIGGILHHLLDLYRPGNGTLVPVDLNALIERVLMLIGGMLADRRIVATRDLAPALPPLDGRSDQLTQVLLNLTRNAIDAMPAGGALHLRTLAVGGCTASEPTEIQIIITDTGCGMSPDTQARIFDPFFTTKADGVGIGLTISQKIIEQHGGRMHVGSVPEAGTTFIISFALNNELKEQKAR